MVLKFEGSVENISAPQLAFIREVIEKRGYGNTKVTIQGVGTEGDNYIANVKRIIITNGNGEVRMIAKIAPQIQSYRDSMNIERLFKNEHIMYKSVLPKFQELEEQANVPKEDRLRFAECYGSSAAAPYEVLILEDMQVPGFYMLDRFKSLSDECIRSVLKNFAVLHSLSYALKHRDLGLFNEYKSGLFSLWDDNILKKHSLAHFKYMENTAMKVVDGDHRKRLVKGSIFQGLALSTKLGQEDRGSKYSIIQQGDAWTNNILFRFDGNSSLKESVMIDYQLSKETNPTSDLLFMVFNCTDHKSRLEHFTDWINYYHSELDKALANHGLKANCVYSRDQIDADLKKYAVVQFGISVILAHSLILKTEDAVKMKKAINSSIDEDGLAEMLQTDDETNQILKSRLEGLVDTCIELGLMECYDK